MNVRDFTENYKGTFEFREWDAEHKYTHSIGVLVEVAYEICKGICQNAWKNVNSTDEKRQFIIECAAVEGDLITDEDAIAVMDYIKAFNSPNFNQVREQRLLEEQAEHTFLTQYEAVHGDTINVVPAGKSSAWLYEVVA